jgi:hypothetical protein
MRYCGMCGRALVAARRQRRARAASRQRGLRRPDGLQHAHARARPEELRDLADEVLTEVAGVIEDYDGYVDAFRGDGLIAVFGAPHSHPDDPYRAVASPPLPRCAPSNGRRRQGGRPAGPRRRHHRHGGRRERRLGQGPRVHRDGQRREPREPPRGRRRGRGRCWSGPTPSRRRGTGSASSASTDCALAGFPNVTSAYGFVADRERRSDPYQRCPSSAANASSSAARGDAARGAERRAAPTAVARRRGRLRQDAPAARVRRARLASHHARAVAGRAARRGRPTAASTGRALAEQLLGVRRATTSGPARTQPGAARLEHFLPGDTSWQRLVLGSLGLVPKQSWTRLERRSVDRTMLAWRDLLVALARSEPGRALLLVCASERYAPRLDAVRSAAGRRRRADPGGAPQPRPRPPADAERLVLPPLSNADSLRLLEHGDRSDLRRGGAGLVTQVGGVPASIFELARALAITQDVSVSSSLVSLLQARLDGFEPVRRGGCWPSRRSPASAAGRDASGDGSGRGEHLGPARGRRAGPEPDAVIPGQVAYRFRSELLRRAVLQMIPFAERPASCTCASPHGSSSTRR